MGVSSSRADADKFVAAPKLQVDVENDKKNEMNIVDLFKATFKIYTQDEIAGISTNYDNLADEEKQLVLRRLNDLNVKTHYELLINPDQLNQKVEHLIANLNNDFEDIESIEITRTPRNSMSDIMSRHSAPVSSPSFSPRQSPSQRNSAPVSSPSFSPRQSPSQRNFAPLPSPRQSPLKRISASLITSPRQSTRQSPLKRNSVSLITSPSSSPRQSTQSLDKI